MAAGLEILTVAEMTAADQAAIGTGTPAAVLMQRAGAAVADAVIARWPKAPVVVLCGPGNNGGDGYVAARALADAGWEVRTASMARASLKGDAAGAASAWSGPDAPLAAESCAAAGVVIDALFGAGLARPLPGEAQSALRDAEAAGVPIVAVDLPSGIPGDAAEPLGYAPRAALTVTFHRKKPAHVLEPSRGLCGEIVVADIGLAAPAGATLFENGPALWLDDFPWPGPQAHKHARGSLAVVSGGMSHTGAPPAAHLEAVMLAAFSSPDQLAQAAGKAAAVVIGPAAGVTDATRANVLALARTQTALLVDADGLTVFSQEPAALFAALDERDVLTPHPGEFGRVFPGLLEASPERITAARTAAKRAGCVVLLKGPDTVIAAPDGRAAVNTSGARWLATAGSGDVLAGFIGGLLAQGMAAFEAACAGAFIHGRAGASFGPGLTAEDLPDLAPSVLSELWRGGG